MIFQLEDPGGAAGFVPIDGPIPTFGDRTDAAVDAERLRIDSWQRSQAVANSLRREIESIAEFDGSNFPTIQDVPTPPNQRSASMADMQAAAQAARDDAMFEALRQRMATAPVSFANVPTTAEAFRAEVDRRLQLDYAEAQDLLAAAPEGSWGAELLGGLWAGATDEATLLTLPFGAGAGSIGRIAITEVGLGVAGEALTLPRQFDMADRLDIEDPNALTQLAIAGATGGVLGGGIAAAPLALGHTSRWLEYRSTRETAEADRRLPGTTPLENEEGIAAAQRAIDRDPGGRLPDPRNFPVLPPDIGDVPPGALHATTIEFAMGPRRPLPPNAPVLDVIGVAVQEVLGPGARVRIVSGQEGGNPRFGSNRHQTGDAADIAIIDQNGELIMANDPRMPELARAFARNGALGIGFGDEYMGGRHVHVDLVEPGPNQAHTWGSAGRLMRDELTGIMATGARPAAGQPPAFSQFDFSRTGNASPQTNRVGYVYGRLLALGYDPQMAAALTGNLMTESGPGLLTTAVGDNGNAFGIGQWNGPRMRALEAFARRQGKSASDLDVQIAFLHHELTTTERGAAEAIRGAPDVATAARIASERFWRPGIPNINRRIGYAREIDRQYQTGNIPRWQSGSQAPGRDVPTTAPTNRGYTRPGTITAGDDFRVDVEYQVVDASLLRQATADLQPRDRTRMSSDEQIADIAAALDPARLMPSPEADRGTPVVGPDNVIESGNGRARAIQRAAERFPDRFKAYRDQIQELGFSIPADVETPILIARRTSDLTTAERQRFVRQANTSAVARMSATERAAADARAIDEETVQLFDGTARLTDARNKPFVMRALSSLPQAERNALVTRDGALNAEGIARLRAALFARAYDAPDIIARYAETGAGELRALMDALEEAAPDMAALRADIAAGQVRPEMDITGHILDAMRLIGSAREIAAREGGSTAKLIEELLDAVDLIEGPVAPLTAALVRKFTRGGKAETAEKIAEFLKRYAAEARKVGTTDAGLFGDPPGPIDVLRAIDKDSFSDVTQTGAVRGVQPEAKIEVDQPVLQTFKDGTDNPAVIDNDTAALETLRSAAAQIQNDLGDLQFEMPDGTTLRLSEVFEDLDADDNLQTVIDACMLGRAG